MAPEQRPLSPHLQIYRFPFAAVLSITHRATGVVLSVAAVFLVYWLISVARGPEAYAEARALFGSWYGLLGLFVCTFALYFHLCNGIRHLIWDSGFGFDLKTVDTSGRIVLVATAVLTTITWLFGML